MESEIFSPPRVLIKCCDCGCPTCSLIAKPSSSSTWFRSVKRKFDEFEAGNLFYVPGLDLYSNPKVQIENESVALPETVCSQQGAIQDWYTELEKERNASSTAATEAMSMILKLQKQKAEIQMEASQFKRFAEEKMAHDQQEIIALEDLVQSLTCEALAYKHTMMSYGMTEAEAKGDEGEIPDHRMISYGMTEAEARGDEGEIPDHRMISYGMTEAEAKGDEGEIPNHRMMSYGMTEAEAKGDEGEIPNHRMISYGMTEAEARGDEGEIRNLSMAENSDEQADLPAHDFPPVKCNLNEIPSDHDVEDDLSAHDFPPVKCSLNENPSDHDVEDDEKYALGESPHTREQNMSQAERIPSASPETKNVYEKVINGDSPRRRGYSRRVSTYSYSWFLSNEITSEFTIYSPRFNIGSPGFNTSFKKTEFVSKMDEISSTRITDKASEVGDDMSDRVYTIDSVHNGATYNEIPDEYTYTPRAAFNMPDIGDPDIKKLYARLQTVEADRELMRQALLSMRTDEAQLVILKEIAQNLSKEMPSNRQEVVPKPSVVGSLPFMSVFKWIGSLTFWRRKAPRSKHLYGLSPNNVGCLMLLDNCPQLRQRRCLSSTQV